MPGQQWTNAELNKARKLKHEENKTLEEIAVILGKTYHSVRIKLGRVERQATTFTENRKKNTAEVNAEVPRIMSDKDLLKFLQVDESLWNVVKVIYGKSEGYRKDRKVQWEVIDGKVTRGQVDDSGELLIKPLFSVKIFLEKKVSEIAVRGEVETLKAELLKYSPKYKKIHYRKIKDGYLYEIAMPDLQLGRLVQEDEAGQASTVDDYIQRTEQAIYELLSISYPIEQILFPIGNDFFNSNTANVAPAK